MPIEGGGLSRANGDKSRQIRRDKLRQMPTNALLPFVAIGFYRCCKPLVPQVRKGMVSNPNDDGFRFQKAARDAVRLNVHNGTTMLIHSVLMHSEGCSLINNKQ